MADTDLNALVVETATTACSVALVQGGVVLAEIHEVVGRGHAERLVPMIAELPEGGRADRVLVDCGPGSFTGVRVGLAAALGLGFGWKVRVEGYSSMAVVAAGAFANDAALREVFVVLEGGHGEVFMQKFTAEPFAAQDQLRSLLPEVALTELQDGVAVGTGVARIAAIGPGLDLREALPRAADVVRLPVADTSLPARPIYGRAPDAKLPAVRA